MTPLLPIASAAALLLILLVTRRILSRRDLPPPPWRLPVLAFVVLVVGDPLAKLVPPQAGEMLDQIGGLVSSLALMVLLIWGLLELPGALRLIRPMPQILRDLLTLLIAAALTVLHLQQARVNLVGLVTTSAVVTAVIGLAAQETLKDLFGGLSMQISAAFQVGDWIDLGNHRGKVESITLMNTVLRNSEGAEIVVPNSQAAAASTRRCRAGEPVGHRFKLGLDYSHPPAQARRLLSDVVSQHPLVLSQPPPEVWISGYGESAVDYEVMFFQAEAGDAPEFRLRGELLQQIWYALRREDRRVPFPVLELRRHQDSPLPSEAQHWQDPAVRAKLLAANPLFSVLGERQRARLAPMTRCVFFGPGETVVTEGEPGDCLYQVVEGTVEVLHGSKTVAELTRGAIFGEMTLLTDAPRNATVRSRTETALLEVERSDLIPLLESNPELLEQLGDLMSRRRQALLARSETTRDESTTSLIRRMRQLFAGLGVN